MRREPLEMNAALTNLLNPMLEHLLGGDIACFRLASPEELWVEADASMLDHVVMTLCINAKDAMPEGGTLTLEPSLAEFEPEDIQANPGTFAWSSGHKQRPWDELNGLPPAAEAGRLARYELVLCRWRRAGGAGGSIGV